MLNCWYSEPQARLSFTQLKYSFKSIIANSSTDNMANYITVQPNDNSYACVLVNEPSGASSQNLMVDGAVRYERLSAAL